MYVATDSVVGTVLRYLAYPLLLGANLCIAVLAVAELPAFDALTFPIVLGTIVYLITLERVIPYRETWHPSGWEWGRDGLYFVMICVLGALMQAAITSVAVALARPRLGLPIPIECVLALVVSSLGNYWFHRLGHRMPLLWRFHGVHHVPEKVNTANNGVVHFIDYIGSTIAPAIPVVLLGFSPEAVFLSTIFIATQGYAIHSNIDMRLGVLQYVLCSPEQHRLHHSVDLDEAGHFAGDIVLWDQLFGTFTWHPNRAPARVGVVDPNEFPPALNMLRSAIEPLLPRRKHESQTAGTEQYAPIAQHAESAASNHPFAEYEYQEVSHEQ